MMADNKSAKNTAMRKQAAPAVVAPKIARAAMRLQQMANRMMQMARIMMCGGGAPGMMDPATMMLNQRRSVCRRREAAGRA